MATRNIIDLSQPITPASPAPCDPPVEFRTVASHGPDSPYQMMWFGMTYHTGTHIDAPLHFVPGGKPIDEADLSALYSMPGVFLDFTAVSCFHKIDAGDVERELKQYGSIPEDAFIMLHTGTGWYSNTQEYFNSPFITPAAAERIIRLRPVAVGVNGPTVDDRRGEGRPIHRAFLSHGVHIIEGIVRSELLAGKRFHCTALPLKLAGFTGSPIRFVAVLEEPA